jgi:hypothetical protein
VEGIVTSSGDVARRKYIMDLSTAGSFVLMVAVAWGVMTAMPELGREHRGVLFIATPLVAVFSAVFAYVCYIGWGHGAYEKWAEEAAERDRAGLDQPEESAGHAG